MKINYFSVHRIINKHNKLLKLLVVVLALLIATISSVQIASIAYLDLVKLSKTRVYGSFTDIIYQDNNATEENYSSDNIGVINSKKVCSDKENDMIFSYINEAAQKYSFQNSLAIDLYNLKDNQCVVTEGFLSDRKLENINKGDSIFIQNMDFTVVDIIKDYGYLWAKGEKEINAGLYPGNIIINKKMFDSISDFNKNYSMLLIDITTVSSDFLLGIKGERYTNHNIYMQSEKLMYHLPKIYLYMTFLVFFVVTFSLLFIYNKKNVNRYSAYYKLGLVGENFIHTYIYEYLVITIISMCIGILFSFIFTSLLLSIATSKIIFVPVNLFLKNIVHICIFYLLTVCVFFLIIEKGDVIEKKEKRLNYVKLSGTKNKNRSLLIHNYKKTASFFLLLDVICLLSSFLIVYMYSYYDGKEDFCVLNTDNGQLLQNADYQISKVPLYAPQQNAYFNGIYHDNSNEDFALFYNFQCENNSLNKMRQQLLELDGVSSVSIYSENNSCLTQISAELSESNYLKGKYGSSIIRESFWNKTIDLKNDKLVKNEIIGLSKSEIRKFEQLFKNKENFDAVINGDAVLMVAPSYKVNVVEEVSQDGEVFKTNYWENVPKSDPKALYDDITKVGDDVSIWYLDSPQTAFGVFTMEQAQKIFTAQKIDTTISGIIYDNVGWFSVNRTNAFYPYRYLVSNEFFVKNNLQGRNSRIGIFLTPDANKENVDLEIRKISSGYGNLVIYDAGKKLESYHAFRSLQYGYKTILIVLFLILSIAVSESIIQSFFEKERERYSIYLLLGISNKRMFFMNTCSYFINLMIVFIPVFMIYNVFPYIFYIDNEKESILNVFKYIYNTYSGI